MFVVIGANDVVNPDAKENEGSQFTVCQSLKQTEARRFLYYKDQWHQVLQASITLFLVKKIRECYSVMQKNLYPV